MELKVLAVGNSFNQDVMAYLPKVLEEMMPDTRFTVATLYTASATFATHLEQYRAGEPYTVYNIWKPGAAAWERHRKRFGDSLTLADALSSEDWDILLTQGTSAGILTDEQTDTEILRNGRELLRILQKHAKKPFSLLYNQWHSRPTGSFTEQETFGKILHSVHRVSKSLGVQDIIPIGTAVESARTNPVFAEFGLGKNMMHSDQVHLAAGFPAMLAAYTTALKIAETAGRKSAGIYGCTWLPTDENCISIACRVEDPAVIGMTHGPSFGATPENLRAAQEIAVLAVRNPDTVTDTKNILL